MAGGRKRLAVLMAAGVIGAAGVVGAASATPDSGDGHQVTICHVTESVNKGYVVITVDVAAFDGDGSNDHRHHYSSRWDSIDVEYDEALGCLWDVGG